MSEQVEAWVPGTHYITRFNRQMARAQYISDEELSDPTKVLVYEDGAYFMMDSAEFHQEFEWA